MKQILAVLSAAAIAVFLAAAPAAAQGYGKVEQPWLQQGKISGGISVTGSSAATALPAKGLIAWICNTGSNDAYLAFGTANTVTATTTGSSWLKASNCGSYDLFPSFNPAPSTYVAAITASSTTTLTVETGLGSGPSQAGSSGGGGAVTNAGTFAVQNTAATPAGTNNIGSVNQASNVTATDCSGTVTTGATAQNAFTAQTTLHGFTIANVDASAGSGEPLWISFTGTATAANGSYPLAAPTATTFAGLSSFTAPPGFGLNHAVSILGATTGHKFSCTWW